NAAVDYARRIHLLEIEVEQQTIDVELLLLAQGLDRLLDFLQQIAAMRCVLAAAVAVEEVDGVRLAAEVHLFGDEIGGAFIAEAEAEVVAFRWQRMHRKKPQQARQNERLQ